MTKTSRLLTRALVAPAVCLALVVPGAGGAHALAPQAAPQTASQAGAAQSALSISSAPALTKRQKAKRAKARAAAKAKRAAAKAKRQARAKARAEARAKARAEKQAAAAAKARAEAEARAKAAAAAAAAAAGRPDVPAITTSGDRLRIANANIKFGLTPAQFAADLATATNTLPDAITLNEMGSRSAAQLTPPGYAHYRPTQPRLNGNAVMWRTDRWRAVDQGVRVLVDDGPMKYDKNRGASWVTLEGLHGEGRISVISVHHMQNPAKFTVATRAQRQALYTEGMVRLRTLITSLEAQGPVFVGGDFNSGFRETNPWSPRVLLRPIGVKAAMEVMGHQKTHDDGGTIDYVFYQAAQATPLLQSVTNIRSDHHLMIYDFTLLNSPLTPVLPDARR